MNKYVIELHPNCKVVQQICESDGQLFIHSKWVDYLEELNSDYINENFRDLQNAVYQKGLEEGKTQSKCGCWGCEYEGKTGEHLPCDYCMNNFTNQWTAKNDKIEVGDEVKSLNDLGEEIKGFLPWIVTIIDEDYCQGIDKEGRVHATQKVRACKTGRHFDIDKILEEMKK